MKEIRILMKKLRPGLIIWLSLGLVSLSVCYEREESPSTKGGFMLKGSASLLRSEELNIEQYYEVCGSCGCSSSVNLATPGFKLYACIDCNNTKLQQGDCVLEGVVNETSSEDSEKLVDGLETSVYGGYKSLFFGKSDFLANKGNGNHLLTRIFEPEFTWERLSYGSIEDNCMVYRDKEGGFDHFKLSYIYTVHGDKNCTDLFIHFVDKYSGSTLYKNLRPFKEFTWGSSSNSMVVLGHDNIEVGVNSFEKVNLLQEFNITFYDLPPKHLFSNEQQEWVPAGIQNPQMEINPKIINERLLLLFQLVNNQGTSITPKCRLENIKVNVVVRCKSVAFQPDPKYSKDFAEKKLRDIHSRHSNKNFKLFLGKLEEKLVNALSSIPNAWLSPNDDGIKHSTPLNSLSTPCKEALYLGDVPMLMSIFNYTSKLSKQPKLSSYITSAHILEDSEENLLLNNVENALK